MIYKAFFGRVSLWALAFFVLLVGIFVYATVDRTEIVSEQLVVIPGTVVSNTWTGVEETLGQDISSESLFQDFLPSNSAFIDVDVINATKEMVAPASDLGVDLQNNDNSISSSTESIVIPEITNENPETSTNKNQSEQSSETGGVGVEAEPINETPAEPESDQVNEPSIDEEPSGEESSGESSSDAPATETSFNSVSNFEQDVRWGVFAKSKNSYPLLQETITTYVTTTPEETVDDSEDVVDNIEENQIEVVEAEPEVILNDTENTDSESEAPQIEESTELEEEQNGADSDQQVAEEGVLVEENVTTEEEYVPPPTVKEECNASPDCQTYDMIFSDFTIPELETGKFITSAQLRLSLAGRTLSLGADELQRFVVEYDYADGKGWQTATVIDINDETSNSINGGYFLVSLEQPANQANIANLQVRISYQGNITKLQRAYVEGVWLEVEASSFFEKPDTNDLTSEINYERDLLEPKFHELNDTELDFTLSSLPVFTLNYSPQQNFFKRVFNFIFKENVYKVDAVRVIDQNGVVVTVPVDFVYQDDKTWTIKFLEQPQKLLPGKYKVEVVIDENETLYTDTFEFYWGVLAVNTTKTMYSSNEKVKLNLAALTDKGDTICDANLQLKVIDPENNIYEVPVSQSGHCGKNNVTDIPDYLADFDKTDKLGVYTVQLQHLNTDGEVVHKIRDTFEVRDYIPYDIERTAPTRIYPPAPYEVKLNIKANRVYDGDIVERIPRGFVIVESEGMETITLPDYTELIWRGIKLEEGQSIELKYKFDAPDISPYMYLLGPLDMGGFRELRQWQIASDALTGIGWFTGTRTVGGTNLNATPSPLQWSTSTVDSYYFTHSTTTDSHQVTLKQSGDYLLAVTLPQQRTDGNSSRTRIGLRCE
jgi:hypothetical protein